MKVDGYKNRQERYWRKLGTLKLGSPELSAKLSARTSAAMYRPEVQAKIRAKRRPQSSSVRKKHSDALIGRRPPNFRAMIEATTKRRSNPGWIDVGGKSHYMMSTWERNVARYLQWLVERKEISEWLYEPQMFIFHKIISGNRTYRPDFKIVERDGSHWWLEVKGWMDAGSRTRLMRMKKYYPSERIEIFDKDRYYALARQVSGLIPEWETAKKKLALHPKIKLAVVR